jgi:hypothetical protein
VTFCSSAIWRIAAMIFNLTVMDCFAFWLNCDSHHRAQI